MKDSWRNLYRRLAMTAVVSGSVAWSSAMCYAVQVAFDSADDTVYANGWQAGDNGGNGFGPWNFDGTYNSTAQHAIDDGLKSGTQTSSEHNNVDRAWTMFNPVGRASGTANGLSGTDIARAGRAFNSPLEVGQTVSVVLDNPTERVFFRGYSIKFNTTGENLCYGVGASQTGCTTGTNYPGGVDGLKFRVEQFAYNFPFGRWQWFDSVNQFPLFDTDTRFGARIDFTLTSSTTYSMTMTPFPENPDDPLNPPPAAPASRTGNLSNPADTNPINWIEFQFFNTDSDLYPDPACDLSLESCVFGTEVGNIRETELYIRSIVITAPDPPGVPGDYNNNGTVDAADYTVWRDHLGQQFQLDNEVSGVSPGEVMIDDYDEWKNRFGATGSGSSTLVRGVPEPGTFVLWFAGSLGLLGLCGRGVLGHGDTAKQH